MQRDGSYSHDTAVTSPNVGQRLKFYGRCSCGWRSRMYPKFVTARFEADLHERVEGIKRELREALVPNDSNSPAVQRWAIAFSEHERGRKTYTDAVEEMAREQEATADATGRMVCGSNCSMVRGSC